MTTVLPEQLNTPPLQPREQFCRPFSLAEILSATNNFDESSVVGRGGFGKVYHGVIDNGTNVVAIKRLISTSKQGDSEFKAEIELLSKFQHTHIVSLIGYCNNSSEMILVYEYMVNGSLADHLYKVGKMDNGSTLSWVQRLKICLGAARGLDYLHTGTNVKGSVIHRDVKSSNILLDKNWTAKVSDFGLSRIGPNNPTDTYISTNVKGTVGYMDPEYLLTLRLTMKSDIYSFGIVLFEVLCGRRAVELRLDEKQWSLARWVSSCIKEGKIHQIIDPKLKWEIFPNSLTEFVRIADQCLCYCSKKRPTMTQVVASLEFALALQLGTGSSFSCEMDIFNTGEASDNLQHVDSEIIAADEAEKGKATMEVIKPITAQVKEAAERMREGHITSTKSDSNSEQMSDDVDPSKNSTTGLASSKSESSDQTHLITSLNQTTKSQADQWVERVETGVYINLSSLPEGNNDLKRVHFSRKLFTEKRAEKWWAENRAKVYGRFNIRLVDQLKEVAESMPEGARTLQQTHSLNETKSQTERAEWMGLIEPGVYITLSSVPGGGNILKRLRFSRKDFTKQHEEKWWTEKMTEVCQRFNIIRILGK